MPFEVDRDKIPADASYLSIVPSILNVVAEAKGPRTSAASACADALAPETIAADINRTESPFLMTASCWREPDAYVQCQTACRPGQLRYNPINDWICESCIDTDVAAPDLR